MQFSWKSTEEGWKRLRSFVSQQFMLLWKRLSKTWENCLEKKVVAKGANNDAHPLLVPTLPKAVHQPRASQQLLLCRESDTDCVLLVVTFITVSSPLQCGDGVRARFSAYQLAARMGPGIGRALSQMVLTATPRCTGSRNVQHFY